jgi:hypothetical protein
VIATTANVTTANVATSIVTGSETLSYGTVNGVAYLNGSKVLTTGSALTFDGSTQTLNATNVAYRGQMSLNGGTGGIAQLTLYQGSTTQTNLVGQLYSLTDQVTLAASKSNGYITLELNGSEQMRLTSTGLGIGESLPAYKLDVKGTINSGASAATGYNLVFRTSGITTGRAQTALTNTSGDFYTGIEGSTAGQTLTGSAAYSAFAGTFAANPLYLVTNSAIRATLDSSGNLGLGVTPSAWSQGRAIEVAGTGYGIWNGTGSIYSIANAYFNAGFKYASTGVQASHYYQFQGQHVWSTAASGTANDPITFIQAMTLTAGGNLLVGTTSTPTSGSANIVAAYATGGGVQIAHTNSGGGGLFGGLGGGGIAAYTYTGAVGSESYTERARIDSSGNLLVQATSSSVTSGVGHKIRPDAAAPFMGTVGSSTSGADVTYSLYSTGAAAYRFYVGYNGTISATTTTISAISDIRFKENVRDLDVGLEKIMALKPRLYDWKKGKGADIKNARGFIAQEFEQVFPDLIDEWKDPAPEGEEPYKAVRADLIPVLVKAIQELKADLDATKAELAALKGA